MIIKNKYISFKKYLMWILHNTIYKKGILLSIGVMVCIKMLWHKHVILKLEDVKNEY